MIERQKAESPGGQARAFINNAVSDNHETHSTTTEQSKPHPGVESHERY